MKLVRWFMGALVALWTLRGVIALVQTALSNAGIIPVDKVPAEYVPFVEAVTPFQLALWGIAYTAFAVAAVRYFMGRRALVVFLFGLTVDVSLFLTLWPMPSYQALASARNLDLAGLALLSAIAIATWWSERGSFSRSGARIG